ncbi:MAG: flagellar basal body-associated FliL family protein [Balneolaceae bacterium]
MANVDESTDDVKIKKRSNFLPNGKYFLIVLVLVIQVLVAYTIVDKNYEKIYNVVQSQNESVPVSFQMNDLIVNPAGSQGKRYLVVEISLELESEASIELIDLNLQRVKHNVNESLAARTVEQLVQYREREVLRMEIRNVINQTVGENSVRNLYFTKYVMQ